jgi:hypothetical protein
MGSPRLSSARKMMSWAVLEKKRLSSVLGKGRARSHSGQVRNVRRRRQHGERDHRRRQRNERNRFGVRSSRNALHWSRLSRSSEGPAPTLTLWRRIQMARRFRGRDQLTMIGLNNVRRSAQSAYLAIREVLSCWNRCATSDW